MSKELTEQFMNDELDDRLYYFTQKMSQDNVEIGHSFAFNMVRADDGEYLDWFLIHEVLAPVPTFDQFANASKKVEKLEKQLDFYKRAIERTDRIEKCLNQEGQIKRLQEQLKEANDVIKKYRRFEVALKLEKGTLTGVYPAVDYLEKWGVK